MQTKIYTLPELTFVGGSTQEIKFNLKTIYGAPYNAEGHSVNFSVCDYSNKTGAPLFSIIPTIENDQNGFGSILYVVIPSQNTLSLYGKYIYQITLIDTDNHVEIPNQGIMYITKNINHTFIS